MIYIYIGLGLLLIIIMLSRFIAKKIFKPTKWGYEQTFDYELEKQHFDPDYLSKFDVQEVYITYAKLKLHAQFINQNSDKTIIIMHGHTYTLYGSYKYMRMFLDRGYNVLMPDQRYHGLSEGKNTTLGYLEADDLNQWIDYINREIPTNIVIGLHGESMGAATVLLGGHNKSINFIISDCSFSDLKTQTQDILKKSFKIPRYLIYPISLVSRLLYNAPLLKINPIDNIKNITAPILFIHGDSDTYIGLDHLNRLIESKKQIDKVYICKDANHAQSFNTNESLYEETISSFLNEIPLVLQ